KYLPSHWIVQKRNRPREARNVINVIEREAVRTVQRQEPVIDSSGVQEVTTRRGATGTVGVSQRSRPGIGGAKLQTSSRAPVGCHLQGVVVGCAPKSVRTDSRLPDRCCPSGITGVGTIKIPRQCCAS